MEFSLLDVQKYPSYEIIHLYKTRYKVEGLIEELKIWFGGDILRSKTVAGVRKELYARIVACNIIHWIMLNAAKKYKKDVHPSYPPGHRMSLFRQGCKKRTHAENHN